MSGRSRQRIFARVADLGLRRPRVVLGLALLVLLVAGAAIPGLRVSTSRTGLISAQDEGQRRLEAFFERFGRPDTPVFMVSGGTPEERRQVVDSLQAAIEAQDDLEGRVLGRVRPRDVAEVLLLQQPDALAQLRSRLPPGASLADLIEGGIVTWLGGLEEGIMAGLDGAADEEEGDEGAEGGIDTMEALAGLGQLAALAAMLEDHIAGRDPLAGRTQGMALGSSVRGIDEAGYLVSAEGGHHLVLIHADLQSDEGRDLEPFVERLRSIRDDVLRGAPEGIRADSSGLPAIIVDELQIIRRGLAVSSFATTAGIFVLCMVLFRSLRQTVVALLPLLPGVVVTLAMVRLLYDDLNLITSSFVAVLLGLGIDFSVHVIARYNEEARGGATSPEATRRSLVRTAPGIMTGAFITAAAFLTTATTEFTAYGELGIVTAIGLLVIMVATFALLPVLVGRRAEQPVRVAPEPPGLRRLPGLVRRFRWPLAVAGILAGLGGGAVMRDIDFNPRYFDFLPQSTESARGLIELEYDALASPVFANIPAESVEETRALAERLRQTPSVAGVQTPSDLLPVLTPQGVAALRAGFSDLDRDPSFDRLVANEVDPQALRGAVRDLADALDEVRFALDGAGLPSEGAARAKEAFASLGKTLDELDDVGRARVAELHGRLSELLEPAWNTARGVAERGHYLPDDLPPLFRHRFVSRDGQALALFAVPAGSFWEDEVAEQFARDVREIAPEASGLALDHVRHGRLVMQGFERAALYAAGIVLLLLLIDFRSLADALLALIPTALGWLWMLGLMVVFELTFDVANIVSLPLVIGIGIAFGVHMMHRVRETPRHEHPSVEGVVRGTGGAIAVAALTTMVGFAGLTTSAYGGMRSFGAVMVLGIGTCLVATLLVLPAVLLILRRVE
jgi:uncharacterized protein